jgi:hypothetical protein
MAFEMEVCQQLRPKGVGIHRQRLTGYTWVYKHLMEDTLTACRI